MNTTPTLASAALLLAVLTTCPLQAETTADSGSPPTPTTAPAPSTSSAEALAAARALLAFTDDATRIVTSTASRAETIAALNALKPRAAELGARILPLGIGKVRRAALELVPEGERRQRNAALEEADKDPELHAVLAEFNTLIAGYPAPDSPPETISACILEALRASARLAQDHSSGTQDRCDELLSLGERFSGITQWLHQGGDKEAVTTLLEESGQLQGLTDALTPMVDWAQHSQNPELRSAARCFCMLAGQCLSEFKRKEPAPAPEAPTPPLGPEVMAAARTYMELTTAINDTLLAGKDTDATREALRALKPRAAEAGKAVQAAGLPRVFRALDALHAVGEYQAQAAEAARRDRDFAPVLEELSSLLRGEADLALPAAPQEIAESLLATLRETASELERPGLSTQDRKDTFTIMQCRIIHSIRQAQRAGREAEVAAILHQNQQLETAINALGSVMGYLVHAADAGLAQEAERFLMLLSHITQLFSPTQD